MDIVLGVSMTPTAVRMVLVEGDKADGRTVDHDVFDIAPANDAANSSASDQVISAILGTQQSAAAGGHRLIAIGVTWSDYAEAGVLRDGLAARGIDDVMLVSQLHAAGALAQAAGRAVGYDTTALLFVERDTATLSVVEAEDGSIVKVVSRSLHSADAMSVMAEMVAELEAQDVRPGGLFVVGSGVDVTAVKEHLEHHVSLPVSAPEDSPMALARGAALAAASAPRFEATTIGLAYSQDPDGPTAADPAFVATQVRPVSVSAPADADEDAEVAEESRRPFLLVGSTLTSIFVVGVVALVISLAVSIRPTVDQRPSPGESIVVPSTSAPAPVPPVAQQVQPPPAPVETKPPETIPAPVPVVQEQPQQAPRQVFVETPQAPASVPAAPPPAPAAEPAPPAAPAPVPAVPAPVIAPPVIIPPVIQLFPQPSYRTPWYPQYPQSPPTTQPQQPPWYPQQPPTTQPQQPPWYPQQPTTQPQRPPVDDEPDYPVIPRQPVVPQQPRQPVIVQPQQPQQQPSNPLPRIPLLPYWPGNS